MHTDRAALPLAREVMKLEILPPGHAAISIIPKATLGIGLKINTNKKVKKGRAMNWEIKPTKTDLGDEKTRIKSLICSLRATPSIINPKLKFTYNMF
jgi:hypothetical protein|tara:strand:+ start:9589 stop:9879 length:291 start_codon:yes stop_codon:yes gene_type:complete